MFLDFKPVYLHHLAKSACLRSVVFFLVTKIWSDMKCLEELVHKYDADR